MKFINFDYDKLQDTVAFMQYADLKTRPQYIVMSYKTSQAIKATDPTVTAHTMGRPYDEMYGLKIAICEALPFGEVDIV